MFLVERMQYSSSDFEMGVSLSIDLLGQYFWRYALDHLFVSDVYTLKQAGIGEHHLSFVNALLWLWL